MPHVYAVLWDQRPQEIRGSLTSRFTTPPFINLVPGEVGEESRTENNIQTPACLTVRSILALPQAQLPRGSSGGSVLLPRWAPPPQIVLAARWSQLPLLPHPKTGAELTALHPDEVARRLACQAPHQFLPPRLPNQESVTAQRSLPSLLLPADVRPVQ